MGAILSRAQPHLPSPIATAAIFGTLLLLHAKRVLLADCDSRTRRARLPARYFADKVALVTGASSGIGAAICTILATHGAHLIISGRDRATLTSQADRLRSAGARSVTILIADLSAYYSIAEQLGRDALAVHNRIDYLFNNAGRSMRVSAEEITMEDLERMLRLNFTSCVALSKTLLPALRQSRGTIVNTSSIASTVVTPCRSVYSASKAALDNYFTALAYENRDIHVLSARPGSTRTNVSINAVGEKGKSFGRVDTNIQNGLDAHRVADRILAATACKLDIAWIANPKELNVTRLATRFPRLWNFIGRKAAAKYQANLLAPSINTTAS